MWTQTDLTIAAADFLFNLQIWMIVIKINFYTSLARLAYAYGTNIYIRKQLLFYQVPYAKIFKVRRFQRTLSIIESV